MTLINKTLAGAVAAATFAAFAVTPAHAEVSASAGIASTYLFRGLDLGSGTPAVSGELKAVAGEFRGILETQTDRLDSEGGASMLTEDELQKVLGASGEQAAGAFGDMLRVHVPRLREAWAGLAEAGDPDVAAVARESSDRLKELAAKLPTLPPR